MTNPHARPASCTVLVVDDDVDTGESLASLLKLAGFQAESACTAEAAIKAVADLKPSAVITDVELQGADALQLFGQLRKAAPAGALFIAHTGWVTSEVRNRALQAGFDGFLSKPADPQLLLSLLARDSVR